MKKLAVLTLAILLLGAGSLTWAQSLVRVDKVSNSGLEKTAKQLETALKLRGMMVVATIDHQNMMKMVGGEHQREQDPRIRQARHAEDGDAFRSCGGAGDAPQDLRLRAS